MSMSIRVKRATDTVFLHVEPSDDFYTIKARLGELFEKDANDIQLIDCEKQRELLNDATVSDQDVGDNDIVYMVFRKQGGWEEITAEPLDAIMEEGKAQDP